MNRPARKRAKATAKRKRTPCQGTPLRIRQQIGAGWFCMLCVCFLRIVLEKSAKDGKSTKAHRLKVERPRKPLNTKDKSPSAPR
jgi:hypothetical protein